MTTLGADACLRTRDGRVLSLPVHRWFAPADAADDAVLDRAHGPVLDVGCGPGRHLVALAERGVHALGIDISPALLAVARRRGARVFEGCVFDVVPDEGQWAAALLLDGNIGIGGDPVALLVRLATVLRADGRVHVELAPPGADVTVHVVRAEHDGAPGPWFRWAVVTTDALDAIARRAGWRIDECLAVGDRHFAELVRR